MAVVFTHKGGSGVATVEAQLKEIIREALNIPAGDGTLREAPDMKVFATSHFTERPCKNAGGEKVKEGGAPKATEEGSAKGAPSKLPVVNLENQCWKYDDTVHGNSVRKETAFKLRASADISYGFVEIKANTEYTVYTLFDVATYLGNVSPRWDADKKQWVYPEGEDEVSLTPTCTEGGCGSDRVSATLFVLWTAKSYVALKVAVGGSGTVVSVDIKGEVEKAEIEHRTFDVTFLHDANGSYELGAGTGSPATPAAGGTPPVAGTPGGAPP